MSKMIFRKRSAFLIVLTVLSFLFICIGTGGSSWVLLDTYTQYGTETLENGLWKSCTSHNGGDCSDYSASSDWMRSCRAMVILSCLTILFGVALALISVVEERVKGYMISICCITSAFTMVIALIVFITENVWTNENSYRYSWTFILAWIGVMMTLLSAVWATMMERFNAG